MLETLYEQERGIGSMQNSTKRRLPPIKWVVLSFPITDILGGVR